MELDLLPPPSPVVKDEARLLTWDEVIQYVKPGYDNANVSLPDPKVASFVGVIRGGRVVASLGLQVRLHAEPLQIEPGHSAVLPSLIKAAEEIILQCAGSQEVFLFAPAGKVSQLATACGMQLQPWNVFSRLVTPQDRIEEIGDVIRNEQHDESRPEQSGGDQQSGAERLLSESDNGGDGTT